MYAKSIQKLIELFSKFPTVGPRTASRFAFYLLRKSDQEVNELTRAILDLKEKVKLCAFCFKSFEPTFVKDVEDKEKLCEICKIPTRDKTLLCVVEKETDLISIESTKKYHGLYFILGGTVSRLRKEDMKKLRTEELVARIKNPSKFGLTNAKFKEIIIATNPTPDGEATALYLERTLKPLEIKKSRLGRGLPVGGELEYTDEETLASALEGRK